MLPYAFMHYCSAPKNNSESIRMKLTDILPIEKWVELEKEISTLSGACANVYDIDGFKIIKEKNWSNRLCHKINHNKKGQTFICASAHQNMAIVARNTKKGVAQECDAGIVKIVVPIFKNDEFIGSIGCCGLMFEDGEVESFLICKTMDIDEDQIMALAEGVGVISERSAENIIQVIENKISKIITGSNNR